MNQIQMIDVGNGVGNGEIDMITMKKVLEKIQSMKLQGAYYCQESKKWRIPVGLYEELKKNTENEASFIEPVAQVSDQYKSNYIKQANQNNELLICKYNQSQISLKLTNYDEAIIKVLKSIRYASYKKEYGWVIYLNHYDFLIYQLKSQFPQLKINNKLDETP